MADNIEFEKEQMIEQIIRRLPGVLRQLSSDAVQGLLKRLEDLETTDRSPSEDFFEGPRLSDPEQ